MTTTQKEPQLTAEGQAFASLLAEMESKLAAMEKRLKETETKAGKMPEDDNLPMTRDDMPEPGGAWIVRAPLETYTGRTAGVSFTNGWGVVYADLPDSVRKVHQLENDFHYVVKAVDAQTLADFQKRMSGVRPSAQPGLAEKLSMPKVFG